MSSDIPAPQGAGPVVPADDAASRAENGSVHPAKPAPPEVDVAQLPDAAQRRKMNVLVVSSVALAFISFWRAAAIVLCDLASSAYYIGGISEQAIGKAAPWFILGVMLFSYAVRAIYVESCTMFTRGGVYRVVKGAVGGGVAKLSVSALMFDYILTGPISAVSAGQYILGLFGDMLKLMTHHSAHPIIFDATTHKGLFNTLAVLIAVGITIYFWRANIIGMHESSDKALRIMQFTTVMGVLIIGWSLFTLFRHHSEVHAPPLHPVFTSESTGWLAGFPRIIGSLGILIAFGHSLLAMSGEESLAQVNREIEAPKLRNLKRAGFVIFVYSMLLTSLISFFAVFIIPDGKRVATFIVPDGQSHVDKPPQVEYPQVDFMRKGEDGRNWGYELTEIDQERPLVTQHRLEAGIGTGYHVERDDGGYRDNLINGLAQFLDGPKWLKTGMEAFVVIVGFLILAGAVNTSIVGSNGVLNRLAEDGVLTPWFQHPQPRYGTTHRLINLIAILQLVVIVASRGDVNTLGEAYAFGVVWSFVFMTLSMAVLRWHDRSPRAYKVPFNIRIHWPVKTGPANGHGLPATATDNLGQAGARVSQAVPADGVSPKPAIRDIVPNSHSGDGKAENDDAQYPDYVDVPIGILTVFLILASTAMLNLLTKKTATIWGIGFTIIFLAAFTIMEIISHRRRKGMIHEHLEQFNERSSSEVTIESVGLKHPDPIIVAARGPRSLPVLEKVLHETDTDIRDVVVVTCKVLPPMTAGITPEETRVNNDDRELLTRIVTVAEEVGKEVHPVVLPTNNPLYAIATTARDLKAREVVLGVSEKLHAEEQLEQFALAWGSAIAELTGDEPPLTVRILGPQVEMRYEMT